MFDIATLLLLMVVLAIFACGLVIMITGVRLTWAMSRDERFPGWQQWSQVCRLSAAEGHIAVCRSRRTDPGDLFALGDGAVHLFGAATLLPAVMYASTVVLYLIKRKSCR